MDARQTRPSLLLRLREGADPGAWSEFLDQYGELVLRYAQARGLQHSDAEDIRQRVFTKLLRSLRVFEYSPERGRFRDYLGAIVRNVVRDSYRRPESSAAPVDMDELTGQGASGPSDPLWQREWEDHHFRRALATLRESHAPRTIEAFEWLLAGATLEQVAEGMSMTLEGVRKLRQRVRERLTEIIAAQVRDEDLL